MEIAEISWEGESDASEHGVAECYVVTTFVMLPYGPTKWSLVPALH